MPTAQILPAVISLPAEIDAANADTIAAQLAEALRCEADVVLADMSAITFCDTVGLRTLIRARRQATANGTDLRLLSPSPAVLQVLKIHGACAALPVYLSLEEALAPGPCGTYPGPAVF
jgi:anti-anti-sigma factor